MPKLTIGPRSFGTVKVGDRRQIALPKGACKELNINPGDVLLVVGGINRRGLAIIKADTMREVADRIEELEENKKEP